MNASSHRGHHSEHKTPPVCRDGDMRYPAWVRSWLYVCALTSGVFALLWLVLRSGTKPSRLAYPCQQAAFGTATAAFSAPFVATIVSLRHRLAALLRTTAGRLAAGGLIALCMVIVTAASVGRRREVTILPPPADYHPDVFLVNNATGVQPDRHGGVDALIALMGREGLKWHRSSTVQLTSGPDGLIDADDVVLIKVNGQWSQRGGTNTDVLRGVIRRIVEHPDGFAGEIVVADNGQSLGSLDRPESNAEDTQQSMQDVVNDFVAESWRVSTKLWDTIRTANVDEYATGDVSSGYVVRSASDPITHIKVSYPKFQTRYGTYISYKNGVWLPGAGTYDPGKLVVINIPVLKTHSIYGITASVKNHMGVVTTSMSTGSHAAVEDGGMGSILSEVRMPDLNILDCIWILARPGQGPSATYAAASRRDQLVAGTDPVALDMWAAKYIMIPQIIENGYTSYVKQDPDDANNNSAMFRWYIDQTMNELLTEGVQTTNDYDAVNLHVSAGSAIPAVSTWGVAVFVLALLTAGTLAMRCQQSSVAGPLRIRKRCSSSGDTTLAPPTRGARDWSRWCPRPTGRLAGRRSVNPG